MREIVNINKDWKFSKDDKVFEDISLPHTWNNIDGTDGGNDYYRGRCHYVKTLGKLNDDRRVYIEFNGVSQTCEVYLNDVLVCSHKGGYSTFRCDITDYLKEDNRLDVYVSNAKVFDVYPQQADFTFYGGIYRDVNLIFVPSSHFELDYFGSKGIKVTPKIVDEHAEVEVEVYLKNGEGKEVTFELLNENKTCLVEDNKASVTFIIDNPHRWNGLEDPYLYEVKAKLEEDEVSTKFGVREIRFDPNTGFYLNGKKYLLRGVSRHQDRANKGCALSKEDHEEDIRLITEMGATAIRLAHYQHDQYFYDLCDKEGFIVWAEIPYISEHLSNGRDNTLSQMKELIVQNYNHPSIICWGLSNEICISNDDNPSRVNNHIELNELCHKLDATRPTAMAHIGGFSCDTNPLFKIPDIQGINIYYGWYEKKVEDVKEYFDSRHNKHPQACFAITEYGADCNPTYCNLDAERGDYSENYQCFYHEKMLEIIEERPYLWGTFVWNMFDFGADSRSEGGKAGQNQKGLVTFDRKYKKDAYYLYKAHWSNEPFIHIANKNYVDRIEEKTRVIVYSNRDAVSLYKDCILLETKRGKYKFEFEFNIEGNHEIKAVSNDLEDTTTIKKVSEPNKSYQLDNRAIINWLSFIDKEREGYFTLDSRVYEILANKEAKEYILSELKPFGITVELLTSEDPRSPGNTLEQIPIKFVLRMCRNLSAEAFNNFAEGLMKIKK